MPLKFKYAAKEQIPPELAQFYVERHDASILNVKGAVEERDFNDLRETNSNLKKQLDDLNDRSFRADALTEERPRARRSPPRRGIAGSYS